jgi:hypothetical protein
MFGDVRIFHSGVLVVAQRYSVFVVFIQYPIIRILDCNALYENVPYILIGIICISVEALYHFPKERQKKHKDGNTKASSNFGSKKGYLFG